MEGGARGPDDDVIAESLQNIGATIMGRRMFGGGDGPWGDNPWKVWWGENPPFHTPVFVLTHHARDSLAMQGATTFHFVTEGIHVALDRARKAAGGKDIALGGGADAAQQYLRAGSTRWKFTSFPCSWAMDPASSTTPTGARPNTNAFESSALTWSATSSIAASARNCVGSDWQTLRPSKASTQGRAMISRHWKGIARRELAERYVRHLKDETFPQLASLPGFIRATLLRREVAAGTEFQVVTLWESLSSIEAFAGSNVDAAVVPSAVQAMMVEFDRKVAQYEVVDSFNAVHAP